MMAPSPDTELVSNKSELPPIMSSKVVKTWELFSELSGNEEDKAQIRSAEIVMTLHDFAGLKDLVPSTYEAAYLIELMEKQSGDEPQATYAHDAIAAYKGKTRQDTEYVRGIARDRLEIGLFLREYYQQSVAKREAKRMQGLPLENPWAPFNTSDDDDDEIPLEEIIRLTSDSSDKDIENPKGVNIESMLIAAASAYNTLHNADDFSRTELLKTVYDIENLYMPYLALIRFDGFESLLKAKVTKTRMLYAQGVEGVITPEDLAYAENLQHRTGLDDIDHILAVAPRLLEGLFPDRKAEIKTVLHNMTQHGIKTGIGSVSPEEDLDYLDIDDLAFSDDEAPGLRWRAKDKYSIAENNHKNPNQYIADLFGMLMIVPTYEHMAEMMGDAYESANTFVSIQTANSASRDTSIVLKGDFLPGVVSPALSERLTEFGAKIQIETSNNGHQVGKITFLYTHKYQNQDFAWPVELQFQTPEDREIATVGEAAHWRKNKQYKKPNPKTILNQRRLHSRRTKTNEPGLTAISKQQSEILFASASKKSQKTVKGMGHSSLI